MFVLLKQKTIETWKEKLGWITQKGGMALLNLHSDYMKFDGGQCGVEQYPASYYIDFLEYIKTKYHDQYWLALPSEMATFWESQG